MPETQIYYTRTQFGKRKKTVLLHQDYRKFSKSLYALHKHNSVSVSDTLKHPLY